MATLEGNTVTVFGSLDIPELQKMWFHCSGSDFELCYDEKFINVIPGESFKVELTVAALDSTPNGKLEIDVLYNTDGSDTYYRYKNWNVTKTEGVTVLTASEEAGNDLETRLCDESAIFIGRYPYVTVTVPEKVLTLSSSRNRENYVTVSIEGNTAAVTGALRYDGLTGIWIRLGGNSPIGAEPGDKFMELTSGETFAFSYDLSNITAPTLIDILPTIGDSNEYTYYLGKAFLIDPIGDGWELSLAPYTAHNLSLINRWINPADTFDAQITEAVKAKSDEICMGIENDLEKLWALHTWVAENIHYDDDVYLHGKDRADAPAEVLENRRAVCDGYSALLEAFIEAQGIPAIITDNYAKGKGNDLDFRSITVVPDEFNHSHTEAFVDGRWVIMDSTWDSNNKYEYGKYITEVPSGYEYFDSDPLVFSMDHIIISRYYEQDLSDIPSEWAKDEVFAAFAMKIVPALLQKDYQSTATRADFARLLLEAAKTSDLEIPETAPLSFNDTDDPEIMEAASLGVIIGYPDGSFKPDQHISREEAAVMLARAAKLFGVQTGDSPAVFSDFDTACEWAAPSISEVSSIVCPGGNRVMTGLGDGTFAPHGNYTREAAILTVYRLLSCK